MAVEACVDAGGDPRMTPLVRLRGIVATAVALLAHDRSRTLIAILGVVIAVLSVTLLAGVGIGVIETGEQQFDEADRDLWVTGGPLELQPGTVGGIENTILSAHELRDELDAHPEVSHSVPMAFQTVYVSTDGEEFDTILATGVTTGGSAVSLQEGDGFSGGDTHYAGGSYDGEMTHEVLVDPETADQYGIEVGDTIQIGGTLAAAQQNEFEVVGISPTFAQFLGTGTATLRLSELQTVTGTASADRATLISVTLESDADPEAVAADLQAAHPEYEIRTNQEQLVATVQDQAVVLASGVSLVLLAVIAGAVLTTNLLMSLAYQQRREFTMLTALGAPITTPIGIAVVQGLIVGTVGGVTGVLLTVPAVSVLDQIAAALTGFEGVVQLTSDALLGGFMIALTMSLLGSAASAWRIARSLSVEDI